MMSREIRQIAEKSRHEKVAFWGLLMGIYSVFYGIFYLRHQGYLIANAEPYMRFLPEKTIGWAMLIFGVIKILGVLLRNDFMKMIGIWGLSAIFGGMALVAFTFSYGSGYPNSVWIDRILVVVICLRISFKGNYRPIE